MEEFDVVIVGAGPVGASLALALKHSGLKLALVEAQAPPAAPADSGWDNRVYAISPGSAAFLRDCGAWQRLDAARVAAVDAMEIFGDDAAARLDFSAREAGLRELAFIAENRLLRRALGEALDGQENLAWFRPAQCAALNWGEDDAQLRLADGRNLYARLIVGADGGDSWVRSEAGIEAFPRPYRQMGVVANFAVEKEHRGIAREWFKKDGVLAFLPLPGRRVSIVWSCRDERARELLALPPEALCGEVEGASAGALGDIALITPPAAFPLRLQTVERQVRPRLALIGDAAHNVHPLAGQGVNLGFRDARGLAAVLLARGACADCGDYALLRRFERARKEDIVTVQWLTDALQKLFISDRAGLARLRNAGLGLVNHLPHLKNLLVQRATN